MSTKTETPAGELSDDQILDALNGTSMKLQADCGYPAPRSLVAVARAAIAAYRASLPVMRAAPTAGWWKTFSSRVVVEPGSRFQAEDAIAMGWRALCFADDVQAVLDAKDADIAKLRADLAAMTAERDKLAKAQEGGAA